MRIPLGWFFPLKMHFKIRTTLSLFITLVNPIVFYTSSIHYVIKQVHQGEFYDFILDVPRLWTLSSGSFKSKPKRNCDHCIPANCLILLSLIGYCMHFAGLLPLYKSKERSDRVASESLFLFEPLTGSYCNVHQGHLDVKGKPSWLLYHGRFLETTPSSLLPIIVWLYYTTHKASQWNAVYFLLVFWRLKRRTKTNQDSL